MSYSKSLIETTDHYSEESTLQCPGAIKLDIQVTGAGVFYQFAGGSKEQPWGEVFNPETFLAPATYLLFRRAMQVRFRSAVPGKPAIVTVEALTAED